jgi:O-antigen/teichoic acid export membrane protein
MIKAKNTLLLIKTHVRKLKEIASVAGYKIVSGLNFYIVSILVIHFYGNAELGRILLSLTISTIVATISFGWLRQSIIRFSATNGTHGIISPVRMVFIYLMVLPLTFLVLFFVRRADMLTAILFGIHTVSLGISIISQSIFIVRQQNKKILQIELVRLSMTIFLVLVVGSIEMNFDAIVLAITVPNLVYLPNLFSKSPSLIQSKKLSVVVLTEWWRYGYPLSAWISIALVTFYSPIYIIEWQVGKLVAENTIVSLELIGKAVALFLLPLSQTQIPRINYSWNIGREDSALLLTRKIQKVSRYISLTLVVSLLIFIYLAFKITSFGDYSFATLAIIVMYCIVWENISISQVIIQLSNETKILLKTLSYSTFLMIILSYLGERVLSVNGALLGGLIGLAFYLYRLSIKTNRIETVLKRNLTN